jgi:predicted RNA binding protein YcfA (HicA-like mRNA interferase family)
MAWEASGGWVEHLILVQRLLPSRWWVCVSRARPLDTRARPGLECRAAQPPSAWAAQGTLEQERWCGMSERLPRLTATELGRAPQRAGWAPVRQTGAHLVLRHPDRPGRIVLPMHT